MQNFRKIGLALFAALLLSFAVSGVSLAHSRLTGSTPAAGARLAQSPERIVITFSEGAEPEFSTFALLDRSRTHFELDHPPLLEGDKVSIFVQPNLPPGAYTVQWKVVSALDGHLTRGSIPFRILGAEPTAIAGASQPLTATAPLTTAQATADPPASEQPTDAAATTGDGSGSEETQQATPLDVAVRWFSFLLAATLVGGAAFALFVQPSGVAGLPVDQRTATGRRFSRRFGTLGLLVGGLLLLSLLAELLMQGARATESSVGAVLGNLNVVNALLSSDFGLYFKLRFAAALAMVALLLISYALGSYRRWLWAALVLLGSSYYLALSLSGHAAAASKEAGGGLVQQIAPLADLSHLLATAFWVGGIFAFVFVLLPQQRLLTAAHRPLLLRPTIRRFSQLAVVSVMVLAVSGTVSYLAHRPTLASTISSDYGRAILLKVLLLLPLLALGAFNLLRVAPRLAASPPVQERAEENTASGFSRIVAAFRRSVRVEAVLLSVVLVASAYLTLSAPSGEQPTAAAAIQPTALALAPRPLATATASRPQPQPTPTVDLFASGPPVVASPPLTISQQVRGFTVTLSLNHADDDLLTALLADASGPLLPCAATPSPGANCVLNAALVLTQLEDSTTDRLLAEAQSGGSFVVPPAPYLNLDGNYQVVAVFRRYNQPQDVKAAFRYTLAGGSLRGKVGELLNVAITTDPDPARSGPVNLRFRLSDNTGQPINDATVNVQGIMAAHGHLADPLTAKFVGDGSYAGPLLLRMGGGWAFDLSVTRPGHEPLLVETSLDVEKSDLDLTPYPTPNFTPKP